MLERPFGKDIMVMDPAMADHGEVVSETLIAATIAIAGLSMTA